MLTSFNQVITQCLSIFADRIGEAQCITINKGDGADIVITDSRHTVTFMIGGAAYDSNELEYTIDKIITKGDAFI